MSKEEAKKKIAELVKKYENLTPSEIKGYNEAATKASFIEPLFRTLGWNTENNNEVAPEHKASNGRVDYAFKLNGVSRFYLEAKPLKADLTNADYIKQAVTYAYNKGVTWAVLTDFVELRLFNAQANKSFLTFNHTDYITDFERLWLLSRESLGSSLLDKEAAKVGALPPPLPIERRLFLNLRQWRENLFNQIHGHQKKLSLAQVDDTARKILDRLIFIRTCEDRSLEDRLLLAAVHQWNSKKNKGELIEELRRIFEYYRNIYDSELFDPHLADSVFIDRPTIENILTGMYDIPGSLASYNFKDIGVDVLGMVYEQYLGYVSSKVKQRLEAQLKLGIFDEETFEVISKKERRKEQGIYYTPQFVTDYIVKETVGQFIKEHDYNEIRTMKILDPACGSGSFLIRAYDELLNYHSKQRGLSLNELDQKDRLPVLLSNIYGVDLDMQAVEVTRLNLLLRTLTIKGKLPYLSNNIRRGNSLISGTKEELEKYFGNNWKDKKPFNWDQEFNDILTNGGFDVVIGNPPYIGFHGFKDEKEFYKDTYKTCKGRFDIYLPFIEKGMQLLKEGGLLGFICPTNFTKRQHGQVLRMLLKNNYTIVQFIDFQDEQVFEGALNYTGIFIIQKSKPSLKHKLEYIPRKMDGGKISIIQKSLKDNGWVFRDELSERIIAKIEAQPIIRLSELTDSISEGIVTGDNDVFVLPTKKANLLGLEKVILKPVIQGRQIKRYFHETPNNIVIYPYMDKKPMEPIPENKLSMQSPKLWGYLCSQKTHLSGRKYFNESSKIWYELWSERSFLQQGCMKIIVPELASNNRFAYCDQNIFYLDTVCGIIPKDKKVSTFHYLLGLLNSTLLEFYYKKTTVPKAAGFYIYKTMFLNNIPIRSIKFKDPQENIIYNTLVSLVKKTMELNTKLAPINDDPFSERNEVKKEIEKTDKEIDNIVYNLYGLTEKERKIVEDSE